jgi:hypothetical protein
LLCRREVSSSVVVLPATLAANSEHHVESGFFAPTPFIVTIA